LENLQLSIQNVEVLAKMGTLEGLEEGKCKKLLKMLPLL
jgi:hypothetical protein